VILKCLDRLFVHGIGFALEVSLRPFAGGHDGVLLLLVKLVEAFSRHQHRLAHEPQRIVAGPVKQSVTS